MFELTEQHKAIQDLARSFAEGELAPHAATWDEKEFFPIDAIKKAGELGLAGLFVNTDYGGSALSRLEGVLVFEELSQGCVSTAAYLSIHNMVASLIQRFGTLDQRETWLPKLCSMDLLSSYCLTESGAGSDAASLKTTARLDGDSYILNGEKVFISGAGVSDLYLCMARTGGEGAQGISAFLVEKNTPGLSFGKNENKMGWRSQPTAAVILDNCRIPVSHRLGTEGDGFKIAMTGLNGGRLNIAACSLGGAAYCLSLTQNYTKERYQFGRPLHHFQSTQFKLADMLTELEAARLLTYQAASLLESNAPQAPQHCAMAKRFATDTGMAVVNQCLQLHGGYGYMKDYQIERFYRDLRVHQILEGTNEVMRVIIARHMLAGEV